MIRTTISIPEHIHIRLRKEALEKKRSLSDVLLEKILKQETDDTKMILKGLDKLTKGIKIKASEYKKFVNYGRKY